MKEWTYFASAAAKAEAVRRWAGEEEGPLTSAVRKRLRAYERRQELVHCLRAEEAGLGLSRGLVATLNEPAYAGAQHSRARAQAVKAQELHAGRVRAIEKELGWRKAK